VCVDGKGLFWMRGVRSGLRLEGPSVRAQTEA
jgi:hypothetical protein